MNRRDWLKKAALIASGVVAADQLEILERLSWTRTVFPAADLGRFHYDIGFEVTREMLEDDAWVPYIQMIGANWASKRFESTYNFESDSYLITPCNQGDPCTLTTKISQTPLSQTSTSSNNSLKKLSDSRNE